MARQRTSKSAPASAVAPVATHDQQPRAQDPQTRHFQLRLRDNPEMVIEAGDADEARAAYLTACGITATENPITCDPLPG